MLGSRIFLLSATSVTDASITIFDAYRRGWLNEKYGCRAAATLLLLLLNPPRARLHRS